jgi:hypothetical protein
MEENPRGDLASSSSGEVALGKSAGGRRSRQPRSGDVSATGEGVGGALLQDRPARLNDLGFDPWLGHVEQVVDSGYQQRWAALAEALWLEGLDPAYAWAGADVGFLVTRANENLFTRSQVRAYQAALARRVPEVGDGDVSSVLEVVPLGLRRCVGRLVADPANGVARSGVDAFFAQAERLGADLDGFGQVSARVVEVVLAWLAGAREAGVDADRVLSWVDLNLGVRSARDAGLVAGLLRLPAEQVDRNDVSAALRERYLPALLHLVAGATAVHGGGDVTWLEAFDPPL